MKRFLLFSFFIFSSLILTAQIQRRILGQTIGVSTKNEVFESLQDKKAYYHNVNGYEAVCIDNTRFGGYCWGIVCFLFYYDKLSHVLFTSPEGDSIKIWSDLKETLSTKYKEYIVEDEEDNQTYIDRYTILSTHYRNGRAALCYGDKELVKARGDDENDEL